MQTIIILSLIRGHNIEALLTNLPSLDNLCLFRQLYE